MTVRRPTPQGHHYQIVYALVMFTGDYSWLISFGVAFIRRKDMNTINAVFIIWWIYIIVRLIEGTIIFGVCCAFILCMRCLARNGGADRICPGRRESYRKPNLGECLLLHMRSSRKLGRINCFYEIFTRYWICLFRVEIARNLLFTEQNRFLAQLQEV